MPHQLLQDGRHDATGPAEAERATQVVSQREDRLLTLPVDDDVNALDARVYRRSYQGPKPSSRN